MMTAETADTPKKVWIWNKENGRQFAPFPLICQSRALRERDQAGVNLPQPPLTGEAENDT